MSQGLDLEAGFRAALRLLIGEYRHNIALMDGRVVRGELLAVHDDSIEVHTPDGSVIRIRLDEIRSV